MEIRTQVEKEIRTEIWTKAGVKEIAIEIEKEQRDIIVNRNVILTKNQEEINI